MTRTTIIDGNNVIGSRPDGWWRDREAATRRLVERLAAWAAAADGPVIVVFDGPLPARLDVVTSDATLAARVRAHGANVLPARAFRDRLER